MLDNQRGMDRRNFMKSAAAYGGMSVLPAQLVLGQQSTGGNLPASERVNLALIGIGNRGAQNHNAINQTGLCNIVALCDVDLDGEQCVEVLQAHPKAKRFRDFRKMFDKMGDQIDAVLISTPDHSHFSIAMLSMSLGKHVYVEKPLAHTFGQVDRLMNLAKRSGVATQMGNQGHSGGNYFQFREWEKAGIVSDVTRMTAFMNKGRRWHGWGPSTTGFPRDPLPQGMDWDTWLDCKEVNPYSEKLHQGNWRCWYEYGSGCFGDWGPHILDTAHEFLDLGLPETITAELRDGPNDFVYPEATTINFAFPKRSNRPACNITWYDGVKNIPVVEEEYGQLVTDPDTGKSRREPVELKAPGKIIYGRDFVFKGGSHADTLQIIPREKYMDVRRSLPEFPQKDSNHYENFLLACKGEEQTRSPFSISGPLTQVFSLGILAQRLGGTIKFDRKSRTITNNKVAQALLDPAPRKGWDEFYNL